MGVLLGAVYFSVPTPPAQDQDPTGHLVLVVVGDCHHLDITAAVRKTDPFGGVAKGLVSDWSVSVRDAQGAELGSYPLDLSKFDLDPAHVGLPMRSVEDVVTTSQVALPVNVPDFPTADRIMLLHGKDSVGGVAGAALQSLLQGGGK